jgi:hypothetical protein
MISLKPLNEKRNDLKGTNRAILRKYYNSMTKEPRKGYFGNGGSSSSE